MFDIYTTAVIICGLLFTMLISGVHIGVALGLSGILGIFLGVGANAAFAQIASIPFSTTNSFTLAVIPLFILMGAFATQASLTTELYRAAHHWLGRLPAGLAMATIAASAAFGAVSGSTVVNAAVFSKMAMPEMTSFGYDRRLSAGCIAASGTLASLIPPSMLMVIYGVLTEQPIGTLLIAGIVPGLLSGFMFMAAIYLWVKKNPKIAPPANLNINWKERWNALAGVWGIVLLFGVVLGGIYTGFFVPTYAGAIGAFGALLIVIAKRRFSFASLAETLKDSGKTTSVIFIIVIGGIFFSRFLTYTGLLGDITDALLAFELNRYAYLLAFIILYLILGMFIEPIAIMVMTLPVMYPVLTGAGFDPIWLGVIAIKLAEMSLMTPPVGLNVYVVRGASPVPVTLEQVFAGVLPFLLADVATLLLLIAFPAIVTALPAMMGN